MDATALMSILLGAFALGLAVFAFARLSGLARRVAEIEEGQRHAEAMSRLHADVAAGFEPYITTRGNPGHKFVLLNRGPARAEGVHFEFRSSAGGRVPTLLAPAAQFPIALDPGQAYPVICSVGTGTALSVETVLRWTDGTGPQERTMSLTVF